MIYYNFFEKIIIYLNQISQKSIDNCHCPSLDTTTMNQGPDAVTIMAAAIAVLMAPHPVAVHTLTHTQDPTKSLTTSSSTRYSLLSIIGGGRGHRVMASEQLSGRTHCRTKCMEGTDIEQAAGKLDVLV